jgi:hypothetical protein
VAEQTPVSVERGDAVDVGNACGADDTTRGPGDGKGKKPKEPRGKGRG